MDCATHVRLFFGSPDLGLETAAPGTFTLVPSAAMQEQLAKDYGVMPGMIFGEIPPLETVLASVETVEHAINATRPSPSTEQKEVRI
jgi:hypothetical protein